MKTLSIFIDESGDFGKYDKCSPYYIVAFIFHDQDDHIKANIKKFDESLNNLGYPNHTIHVGPLIRREESYKSMSIDDRKHILNISMQFARNTNVKYKTFLIQKSYEDDELRLIRKLSKAINDFVDNKRKYLDSFEKIIVYYDNGQVQLTRTITSIFSRLNDVEFRKVYPSSYKLFQIADLICTFTLLEEKNKNSNNSKSEISFFKSMRSFKRDYLKQIKQKELI